jgi:hypothetical protein
MKQVLFALPCCVALLASTPLQAQTAAPGGPTGAPAAPVQADASKPWSKYIGTWRADPRAIEGMPNAPYLLRVSAEGSDLVMEWNSMAAKQVVRLPLDGRAVSIVDEGRPVEMRATLEGPSLIVTTTPAAASGPIKSASATYAVSRNRLTIERTRQTAQGETTEREVFTKVPTNILTHGGTGALGPTGPTQR